MKKVFNKVVVAGLLSATIGISIATTVSCSKKNITPVFQQNTTFTNVRGFFNVQKIDSVTYAETTNGLYNSTDGKTFKKAQIKTIGNIDIQSLKKIDNIIYLVDGNYNQESLLISKDDGKTFNRLASLDTKSENNHIYKITKVGQKTFILNDSGL